MATRATQTARPEAAPGTCAPVRIFLCDDEPLALDYLEHLLADLDGVQVVGRSNGDANAARDIGRAEPDLVFLDIAMPAGGGFAVVEQLLAAELRAPPLVAFVTAFGRFAVRAFEAGAIDFLTKPASSARLGVTLDRARASLSNREAHRRLFELETMLPALRAARPPAPRALWILRRGERVRVDLAQVARVAAEGPYVRLHLAGTSYLHKERLGALADQLADAGFVRVHRGHLVRTDLVSVLRRNVHGGWECLMADGARIPVGRKFVRPMRETIGDARARHLRTDA